VLSPSQGLGPQASSFAPSPVPSAQYFQLNSILTKYTLTSDTTTCRVAKRGGGISPVLFPSYVTKVSMGLNAPTVNYVYPSLRVDSRLKTIHRLSVLVPVQDELEIQGYHNGHEPG
jgi:hypothetical protein